ncbi:MAG: ribbon-helix-helix protein, CopG family [Actinomycetota bacterium]|nr:ribbon-helix-helix protein, CopG family [Actinomycetota bacterium]
MIRTQIQLTEQQIRELRKLAAERQVSLATVVREAVDRMLEQGDVEERRRRALEAIGGFRSGHTDISEDHDRYLAEDFWDAPE